MREVELITKQIEVTKLKRLTLGMGSDSHLVLEPDSKDRAFILVEEEKCGKWHSATITLKYRQVLALRDALSLMLVSGVPNE